MSVSLWFGVYVVFNVLLLTALAINVSRLRIVRKVAHGDGGDVAIKAAIRTHVNGVENVPIFALVLLALEFAQASTGLLAGLVLVFCAARLAHAVGMLTPYFNFRRLGAGLTYACQSVGALAIVPSLLG